MKFCTRGRLVKVSSPVSKLALLHSCYYSPRLRKPIFAFQGPGSIRQVQPAFKERRARSLRIVFETDINKSSHPRRCYVLRSLQRRWKPLGRRRG